MINWFARNPVAANLLMVFIVVSGLIGLGNVRGENFPEVSLDMVNIEVPYLGAAPEEVEEGVCIRIEEAIQGVDGIKRITSTAAEGVGTVLVEVELGADVRTVLDDVKNRVDAIDTFPEQTEKPIISEMLQRTKVIDVAVSAIQEGTSRVRKTIRELLTCALGELAEDEDVIKVMSVTLHTDFRAVLIETGMSTSDNAARVAHQLSMRWLSQHPAFAPSQQQ